MNISDISDKLGKHRKWLNGSTGGEKFDARGAVLEGADFGSANLAHADLSCAVLTGANFESANLAHANLRDARLSRANLYQAVLISANLRGAFIPRANLCEANLCEANLLHAELPMADLTEAYCYKADFSGASLNRACLVSATLVSTNLNSADLCDANLSGADLRYACLRAADLADANTHNTRFSPFQIASGTLIVWKKVKNHIVRLRIPDGVPRTGTPFGRKCRAAGAIVEYISGGIDEVVNYERTPTRYRVGCWVHPDEYNNDFRIECSNGIHFFLTEEEAKAY